MLLTWSWKLRPTRAQHRLLEHALEIQRHLYNAALEERIGAWRRAQVSILLNDQMRSLTQIRKDDPEGYGRYGTNMSRWTLRKLDDAMQGFFRRLKSGEKPGYPRFRSGRRWRSFGFAEWNSIRLIGDRILMKGFDRPIRINLHRPMPADAVPKRASITRRGRSWYVHISIETSDVIERHAGTGGVLGIDAGVSSLATLSDGIAFKNERAGSRRAAELRRSQRALRRCHRGSRRREKVRARVQRLYRRIADVRATHLHRVSSVVARFYPTIVVEELQVSNMVRASPRTVDKPSNSASSKRKLNSSILDAGMATFITMLTYKAERSGGRLMKVDARYTSQDCSACGTRVPKKLWERTHACPECGLVLNRDLNAARNILARGIAKADAGV